MLLRKINPIAFLHGGTDSGVRFRSWHPWGVIANREKKLMVRLRRRSVRAFDKIINILLLIVRIFSVLL